jgi:diguanylate cyclase (GGDEF)-like protein
MIKLRGLSARIVIAVVLFVAALQAAMFVFVSRANSENARDRAAEELVLGELAFNHALNSLRQQLRSNAALLAADPALRDLHALDAAGGAERLAGRAAMTPAHVVQVIDAGGLRASAMPGSPKPPAQAPMPALADAALVAQTLGQGAAESVVQVDGRVYDVAAVAMQGQGAATILVLAVAYDDVLARELSRLTTIATRFELVGPDRRIRPLGSSAPAPQAEAETGRSADDRVQRVLNAAQAGEWRVQAVLERSLADVLPVFERLQLLLLLLTAASIALALAASLLLAHAVTRPLRKLTEAAQRIRDGDYREPIRIDSADEIGTLADSLNHMRLSIAERDEQNQRLAYSDTLTGLPNRTRLVRSIRLAIEQARSEAGIRTNDWVPPPGHAHAAVMLLDLDRFKQINDTLGHRVGDAVLNIVSKRIAQAVRMEDTVARLGGDEFAIALPRADESVARGVAREVTKALKTPIDGDELNKELVAMQEAPIEYENSIDVGASIGIALYPEDGVDDQTLLRRADIAMYAAKRNGVAVAFFDTQHEVARLEHLSLVSELRRAVEETHLLAYYQPKLDLKTNRVIGAEALVRWRHPQRGMLSPADFLPYAEQTGHISWVTRWMLAVTLRQCGAWAAAGTPMQIAINLSARDLMRPDLVTDIEKRLRDHAVPPHLVCLEITESTFMQDPDRALRVLHDLRALGVHLSIDDFGTGFSSLSYMKRLPVHELKIDATFVQGMAISERDVAIVRSTIDLAHSLGLKVVAEGVEDERCLARLREMDCDLAQGYLIGRPVRRSAFEKAQKLGGTAAAARPAGGAVDERSLESAEASD